MTAVLSLICISPSQLNPVMDWIFQGVSQKERVALMFCLLGAHSSFQNVRNEPRHSRPHLPSHSVPICLESLVVFGPNFLSPRHSVHAFSLCCCCYMPHDNVCHLIMTVQLFCLYFQLFLLAVDFFLFSFFLSDFFSLFFSWLHASLTSDFPK